MFGRKTRNLKKNTETSRQHSDVSEKNAQLQETKTPRKPADNKSTTFRQHSVKICVFDHFCCSKSLIYTSFLCWSEDGESAQCKPQILSNTAQRNPRKKRRTWLKHIKTRTKEKHPPQTGLSCLFLEHLSLGICLQHKKPQETLKNELG